MLKTTARRILQLASLFTAVTAFGDVAEFSEKRSLKPYSSYLEVGGAYHSSQPSYGETSLFIPLLQNYHHLFYTNLLGFSYSTPALQGSAGLGYRYLSNDESWMLGAYSFYDFVGDDNNYNYQQSSVGLEFKTLHWSVNSAGYFPIGKTTNHNNQYDQYQLANLDNPFGFKNLAIYEGQEKALSGVSAELGRELNFITDNLTWYVGGYYYSASQVQPVAGPSTRLRYFYDVTASSAYYRFAVETGMQYDKPRGTDWYVGASIRLGFGGINDLTGVAKRMLEAVPHNNSVVVRPTTVSYENALLNGKPVTVAEVTNEAGLDNAIDHNATVIAVHGDVQVSDTKTLQANQALTAGDYVYNGKSFTFSQGGSLTATDSKDLLQVTQNNTIQDITLNVDANSSLAAIRNDQTHSFGDLNIHDVNSTGVVSLGVTDGTTDSSLSFANNRITLGNVADTNALDVTVGNSQATVTQMYNNTISVGSSDGNILMNFETNNGNLVLADIHNNSLSSSGGRNTQGIALQALGGSITAQDINNNQIQFAEGINQKLISVLSQNKATLSLNNINHNELSINNTTKPTNYGVNILANDATLSVNEINHNIIDAGAGQLSMGISVNGEIDWFSTGTTHVSVNSIDYNQISIGSNTNGAGVTIGAQAGGGIVTMNVGEINHNNISFADNSQSGDGINISASTLPDGVLHLTVDDVSHNNITIGDNSAYMYAINYSLNTDNHDSYFHTNHLTNNTATFGAGQQNANFISANNNDHAGDITLKDVKNNQTNLAVGNNNYGIHLNKAIEPSDATIHIVADGVDGLRKDNNNVIVNPTILPEGVTVGLVD
tara:strand:- start:5107 stop:7599 length:2493 start_codon:yes stop_codon:yes gene_type:complete